MAAALATEGANTAQRQRRASCCVAALCGLPGAGKSTVAAALAQAAPAHQVEVVVLALDAILKEWNQPFTPEAWQDARQELLKRLQALVLPAAGGLPQQPAADSAGPAGPQPCSSAPLRLVLVDDNHPLAVQRRNLRRIARDGGAAFVQVFCSCPLDAALAANASRPPASRVPGEVVVRMARDMDVPQGGRDGPLITLDTGGGAPLDGEAIWWQLWEAWGPAVPLQVTDADQERARAESRAATAASLLHTLDITSRRAVSAVLSRIPRAECAAVAARLNALRRDLVVRSREVVRQPQEPRHETTAQPPEALGDATADGTAAVDEGVAALLDGMLAEFVEAAATAAATTTQACKAQ